MPDNNIGDVIRMTAKMTYGLNDDDIQNVYHGQVFGSDVSDDDLHEAIMTFLEGAYTQLLPDMTDEITFAALETWNITQDRPIKETAWATLTYGGNSTTSYVSTSAPLVLFNTNTARSQGRKFLPPVTEAGVTDGILSGTVTGHMVDFAAAILANILEVDVGLVMGNWSGTLARFAPFVGAVVSDILATQRRRRRGRGS
jgi:hypothetical protein